MGSLYFDKKLFIFKFLGVESCGVESCEVESCGVKSCGTESLLPMPLNILSTKSLT